MEDDVRPNAIEEGVELLRVVARVGLPPADLPAVLLPGARGGVDLDSGVDEAPAEMGAQEAASAGDEGTRSGQGSPVDRC